MNTDKKTSLIIKGEAYIMRKSLLPFLNHFRETHSDYKGGEGYRRLIDAEELSLLAGYMLQDQALWKSRFDKMADEIKFFIEDAEMAGFEVSETELSVSQEFYISNNMDVVDNLEYALENWGEGKFFKVVRSK